MRYSRSTRSTRQLRQLCDVPDCARPGESVPVGHLCDAHAARFEAGLRQEVIFTTEPFLNAVTAEDDERARKECYSLWLGEVARAT